MAQKSSLETQVEEESNLETVIFLVDPSLLVRLGYYSQVASDTLIN